ncbi:MAG: phosphoenolpyruvate carboxykinase (ATP) [Acidaminococcaceae bacterium]|nr:phosphoenolpyruvate carboxykinase (ATP) [Acidaminococcaceae bacterium]
MAEASSVAFLENAKMVVKDLSIRELIEEAVRNGEGTFSQNGALRVITGKHTGRSPNDKFIVDTALTHDTVCWSNNKPCSPDTFARLYAKMRDFVKTHKVYVTNLYAGADEKYSLRVKFINEFAWQQLFVKQLFINNEEPTEDNEDFTVICLPSVIADPELDGTFSDTFIILNFDEKMVIIGGGSYAGEIKKSIFSVMNYLLPKRDILTMHCSANVGKRGDVALFFGLSGTGKTTLSADPERALIGDDEHGWSDRGVFNIEGGCYAKCVNLTEAGEPEIYNAIKFGSVVENVWVDEKTGMPDFFNTEITENSRVAYPLEYIPNAKIPSCATHPRNIVFLTADAFGVLPPIAKLTKNQAMYHFLAGYTSKVAGTECGITEPQATFSTAFGEPFLPLPPLTYAKLLGQRIVRHETNVYLVNTGWSGGPYSVGRRMKLEYTRAMITAALNGELGKDGWNKTPVFGLDIPNSCPNVPDNILNPIDTWFDKKAYHTYAHKLALLFADNIKKFQGVVTEDILNAGPRITE